MMVGSAPNSNQRWNQLNLGMTLATPWKQGESITVPRGSSWVDDGIEIGVIDNIF
jgi:hypothetical protein